jgi:hypothetical protein
MSLKGKFIYFFVLLIFIQFCTLLVSAESIPHDVIYIRDYNGDDGTEPIDSNVHVFWESPDIEVILKKTALGKSYLEILCTIHSLSKTDRATELSISTFWSPPTTSGFNKDKWNKVDLTQEDILKFTHKFPAGTAISGTYTAAIIPEGSEDFVGIMGNKQHVCVVVELRLEEINNDDYDCPESTNVTGENNMGWRNVFIEDNNNRSSFISILWNAGGKDDNVSLELISPFSRKKKCKLIDSRLISSSPKMYRRADTVTPYTVYEAQLKAVPEKCKYETEISVIQRVNKQVSGGVTYIIKMPVPKVDIGFSVGVAFKNDTIEKYLFKHEEGLSITNSVKSMKGYLSYNFTRKLSAVAWVGYSVFESDTDDIDDDYWVNISGNLKYRLYKSAISPFFIGGIGYYIPKYGDEDSVGFNVGTGFDIEFNRCLYLKVGADYHNIFKGDVRFVISHLGIVARF